jgi:hypothetical protein
VFGRFAGRGDSPAVVWQDPERVRRQYRAALGYSLDAVAAFLRDRLDPDSVVLLLGDHPPASLVTGPDAPRQVPVHLIAPPEVTAAVADWGWTAGARPGADAPVWRMDALKRRLLDAFDAPTEAPRPAGGTTAAVTGAP